MGVKLFPITIEPLKGEITMETKDEQHEMKMEYKPLDKKMNELSDDELEQVTGGGQCDNIQERLIKALKGG